MRFMAPSFSRLEIPDANDKMTVLKHLERIGRVCYKSEDKITDDSCIRFLENIKKRKHWAMLEHYVFVMEVPDDVYNSIMQCMFTYNDIPDFNHRIGYIHMTSSEESGVYRNIVSGSATAFNYLWEVFPDPTISNGITMICRFLESEYPELMRNPCPDDNSHQDVTISDEICFLSRQEIESLPVNERMIHDTMSVRFITNRGVSHEIVRHRPASYAQESTRYCNYGSKGCMFIVPNWLNAHDYDTLLDHDDVEDILDPSNPLELHDETLKWLRGISAAETAYCDLLDLGLTAQNARGNLPNDLKTEIVMTANLYEWHHFFDMRADKPAHPQMKEIAYPLLFAVHSDIPYIFDDLRKRAAQEGYGI